MLREELSEPLLTAMEMSDLGGRYQRPWARERLDDARQYQPPIVGNEYRTDVRDGDVGLEARAEPILEEPLRAVVGKLAGGLRGQVNVVEHDAVAGLEAG